MSRSLGLPLSLRDRVPFQLETGFQGWGVVVGTGQGANGFVGKSELEPKGAS